MNDREFMKCLHEFLARNVNQYRDRGALDMRRLRAIIATLPRDRRTPFDAKAPACDGRDHHVWHYGVTNGEPWRECTTCYRLEEWRGER